MSFLQTLSKLFLGDPIQKGIEKYKPLVEKVNVLEPAISALSDPDLQAKTVEFKQRLSKGETLDQLLPEAFAVVREASKRTLKMRHFDVQLIGGMVLHDGKISEMKTGEGKTLMSTLPAYLNALSGQGVYMVTVNDYLAKRDQQWMGQIFRFLGLSVGLIQANMPPQQRREAYAADITYGTNNEFGFDYLRDNLARNIQECCQTRRHYAIIDEVDSILIDEARTPLIISGSIQNSAGKYKAVVELVRKLEKETHFTVDEKHKNIVMTEEGNATLEGLLKIDNLFSVENMDLAHSAVQCLKALYLFKKDVDYVVNQGEVVIVDEFTGRLMEGRRYSDGLHQAIEAVEGVSIREESQTLASVTFQNYFRMFPKLAGMTGTAKTEEDEFIKIYGLAVVVIPTHNPMVRQDRSDIVYKTKAAKYRAIVKEVKECYEKGQPVLLGTITIDTSELLSGLLKKEGIPHRVLNAKYHEQEAEIVAAAGQSKKVTIATNMAGRGTDIVLGEGVKELGGLYVIGSERHESRRIDNQLRGRSGRQGDQGASRFYVSLEDELMRLFGSDRIAAIMSRLGLEEDEPIEHGMVTSSIERAQKKVERYHFGVRKQILQYDDVMDRQRQSIYSLRMQLIQDGQITDTINRIIDDMVANMVSSELGAYKPPYEPELLNEFAKRLQAVFPIRNITELLEKEHSKIQENLIKGFKQLYAFKCQEVPQMMFETFIVKPIFLMTLDRKWIDHLHNMDQLREGVGLRAWGQKDPLMEYKLEAFDLFKELLQSIYEEGFGTAMRSVIADKDGKPLNMEPAPGVVS